MCGENLRAWVFRYLFDDWPSQAGYSSAGIYQRRGGERFSCFIGGAMSDDPIVVDQHLFETLSNHGLKQAIHFAETRLVQELTQKGNAITNELTEYIAKTALHEVMQLTSMLRKKGLPADFAKLFEIQTKKEAKRFAGNELVINHSDFADFILNAELFGYFHTRKHREFIPEELKNINSKDIAQTDPESGRFTKAGKKALTKVYEVFKQRRQLSVHWFQFNFEWHCFFFDSGDLIGGHWEAGGDHIHYLSHLWGIPGNQVWNGFDSRDYSPAKAHIRYVHNLRGR